MDKRIEIYCDGEKCFVISLHSICNTIFSLTPIVKSIIGFNFDEDKQINEWYCLNISKEYLKIFIQLIRKEISIFSDFNELPKVHYDFYGIEIIQEKILEDFFKNYELDFEKKEFYINNNKITINEIINAISMKPNSYYRNNIIFKTDNQVYENICILCKELNKISSKFLILVDTLDSNSISNLNQIIRNFNSIDIEYTDNCKCFIFPYKIIYNINLMDITKFNLLQNYNIFSEIDFDILKVSLLEYKHIYKIINKIYDDKCQYIKQF